MPNKRILKLLEFKQRQQTQDKNLKVSLENEYQQFKMQRHDELMRNLSRINMIQKEKKEILKRFKDR